jgi:hypothetical protein
VGYREHIPSEVVAKRDAIREMVQETQRARVEAARRRRRRGLWAIGGAALALGAAVFMASVAGVSVPWLAGAGIMVIVLGGAFWLGSSLEPHGDNPPLRHG